MPYKKRREKNKIGGMVCFRQRVSSLYFLHRERFLAFIYSRCGKRVRIIKKGAEENWDNFLDEVTSPRNCRSRLSTACRLVGSLADRFCSVCDFRRHNKELHRKEATRYRPAQNVHVNLRERIHMYVNFNYW